MTITNNIKLVQEQIKQLAEKYNNKQVKLLAVSKTKSINAIEEAYQNGLRDFGENYLQEALSKINALQNLNINWHFIGSIQSNKAKQIALNFDFVHTIDNLKIAQKLNKYRESKQKLKVFLQVNIDEANTKSGCLPKEAKSIIQEILKLQNLELLGLMAVPDYKSFVENKENFRKLKDLQIQINKDLKLDLSELSIGMSSDLEEAISENASFVRIGTKIFGARN